MTPDPSHLTPRTFLDRLWPARLRQTPELISEQRLICWRAVTDQDLCLRAVMDLLGDSLEGNASVAFNPEQPAERRLLACDRAGIAWQLMQEIERERAAAQSDS